VTFETAGERIAARRNGTRVAGRAHVDDDGVEVWLDAAAYRFAFVEPPRLGVAGQRKGAAVKGVVTAPMPGKILKIAVKEGEEVAERGLLLILEAMKMEHRIEAPHAGVVRKLAVEPGLLVASGAQLLEIE
jgi:biotin carboxyl carrier protein